MSYKGEVAFQDEGREMILVLTHDALDSLETRFKCKVSELNTVFDGGLTMKDLAFIFHEGLKEYHKDVDPKAASKIISRLGIVPAQKMLVASFLAAMGLDEEAAEDGASDPPNPDQAPDPGASPTA